MKYRANVGGGIVEAQKIKDYRFDVKTFEQYVVLADETRRPQPVLHGMRPMIGDWYVETSTGTTRLRDGSQYEERSAAAIIKAVDFALVYTPVIEIDPYSEFATDLANYQITPSEERANTMPAVLEAPYKLSDAPQPQDPYTVFVMPDQGGPMQEIINADDVVTEESGATLTPEMLALGEELADRVEETDKILTASMTGHTPDEVEEMLKQSLPKIIPDVIGDDVVDEEPTEETQAHAKETIAAYTEIEMVDNQTADGE